MKWNWGTKIFLSFVGFAGFMGYLVVMSFQENIDLVTEDYYGEELKYEQRMSQMNNANNLESKVIIRSGIDNYLITFPQEIIGSASIHFYKPDNKKYDRVYDLIDHEGSFQVLKKDLFPGKYRVKVSWEVEGKKYYHEEIIFSK